MVVDWGYDSNSSSSMTSIYNQNSMIVNELLSDTSHNHINRKINDYCKNEKENWKMFLERIFYKYQASSNNLAKMRPMLEVLDQIVENF